MAVGDVYRARLEYMTPTGVAFNITHWFSTAETAGGVGQLILANAIGTNLGPLLKPLLVTSASFQFTHVQRLTPPVLAESVSANGNGPGTVAGDALPGQTAGLLTLRTPFAGRRNRGRMYIPAPGEADNDALNLPTAGYLGRLNNLGTGILTPIIAVAGGASTTIIIGCKSASSLLINAYVTHVPRAGWGTQRRRSTVYKQRL